MENIYTCSFCGKKEKGKDISYLLPHARVNQFTGRPKVKLDGTNVALRPDGWDWDIVPVTFGDLWSCGCHKIRH